MLFCIKLINCVNLISACCTTGYSSCAGCRGRRLQCRLSGSWRFLILTIFLSNVFIQNKIVQAKSAATAAQAAQAATAAEVAKAANIAAAAKDAAHQAVYAAQVK